MLRKLRCVTEEEWIGGVCAGLAYWLGIPTWIVRLLWVFEFFIFGVGFFAYILLWIFMPNWEETPGDYEDVSGS